jgi:hypothetical protein
MTGFQNAVIANEVKQSSKTKMHFVQTIWIAASAAPSRNDGHSWIATSASPSRNDEGIAMK